MSRKMKTLAIALGVMAILIVSFASVAMAAAPGGAGTGDCIYDGDGPVGDQLQQRDRLQDCDPMADPIQDRTFQQDRLRDCTVS